MTTKTKVNKSQKRTSFLDKQIKELISKRNAIIAANERFSKKSDAEKRVAIAEDVIAQIKTGKFKAKANSYVILSNSPESLNMANLYGDNGSAKEEEERNKQFFEVIEDIPECKVCARGAMFLSSCRVFDNLTVGELIDKGWDYGSNFIDSEDFKEHEEKFFDPKQVCLIETAFERMEMNDLDENSQNLLDREEVGAAIRFGNQESLKDPKKRLIAIMKNIISNKGSFVIPEKFKKKK